MWSTKCMGSAALALTLVSACSGAVSDVPAAGAKVDAGQAVDGGGAPVRDAEVEVDASTGVRGCTGSEGLPIAGDYVAPDGSEHWIRVAPHATTYTRIPGGPPTPSSPPRLDRVVKVCGDQRSFIATSVSGAFTRVDWSEEPAGLRVCIAADDSADLDSAIAAATTDATSSRGCRGRPWTVLARTMDGGR